MIPEEFKKRMKNTLEEDDFQEFMQSFEEEPLRSLRKNGLKKRFLNNIFHPDPPFFSGEKVEWFENACYYNDILSPGKHPFHEAGVYYIQEASAMAPPLWLDAGRDLRVLDLCAAPGGKSTMIAELLDNTGLLVANEPVISRAKILSLNIERMGIMNTLVTNEPPEKLSDRFEAYFDRILVDAPCSGEGMFRKDITATEEWSPENVVMCASRQASILKEAAKMLIPGGIMVYSTCTFSRSENEECIAGFLANEPDFSLLPPEEIRPLPSSFCKTVISHNAISAGQGIRIWPHKAKGEGHFFAVLKRKGSENGNIRRISRTGTLKEANPSCKKLFKDFCRRDLPGLTLPEGIIHSFGDQLYFSNKFMPGMEGLKVLRPGLHLGTVKKDRFEPSHALALFSSPDMAGRNAALSGLREAEKYIRGESLFTQDISFNGSSDKGWCLISLEGYSLGWGKYDGRMIKNHYPKGLRIN